MPHLLVFVLSDNIPLEKLLKIRSQLHYTANITISCHVDVGKDYTTSPRTQEIVEYLKTATDNGRIVKNRYGYLSWWGKQGDQTR